MIKRVLLSALVLFVWLPVVADAAIIFDNIGPTDSYQQNGNGLIKDQLFPNDPIPRSLKLAAAFSSPSDFQLGSLELALTRLAGPNEVRVSLVNNGTDGFRDIPGSTVLEEFLLSDAMPFDGVTNSPVFIQSQSHASLLGGTKYWVVTELTQSESSAVWNYNSTSDTASAGEIARMGNFPSDPPGWNSSFLGQVTSPAFRVSSFEGDNTAIPEPSTVALFGLGVIGLIGRKRRRKQLD